MLAVFSSNHRQRSGRNLVDGHAIPGSGLLLTTWETPTLGFRKQERQLRTGSTGGCLRSIAQRTRSGAWSYWIGLDYDPPSTGRIQQLAYNASDKQDVTKLLGNYLTSETIIVFLTFC